MVEEGKEESETTFADDSPSDLKIILLGDSACGKSKLIERFLLDEYEPRQLSTYALTMYRHLAHVDGKDIKVDFWDTAGQERFADMHPSYYYRAHACVLVFDVTRKATYKHLGMWLDELRQYCEDIPVLCVANKIDIDENVTSKVFKFPKRNGLVFDFVSAAKGTNVVKAFEKAIQLAWTYKTGEGNDMEELYRLLDTFE